MNGKRKLAIITTHPIQYNAPLFSLLAKSEKILPKVFYTWEQDDARIDREFGKQVVWDIPLLTGYDHCFVSNGGDNSRGFWDLKNPGLNKAIEEWGADAILIFGWNYYSHLKAMMHFKGKIPVLFRGDSHLLDKKKGITKFLRKVWLSWVYRHIDFALYVGKNNKNYYLEYGLEDSQLIFAPHAIDIDHFTDQSAEYEAEAIQWRASLGIQPNEIVFLFAGKLIPKKNPELLIQSFISLNSSGAVLVMAGNGALEFLLKQKYSDNSSIHFLDFQNQSKMPILYRLGDIFVLPSKGPGETWGLAVNEAMACNRAIIVSDKCGCAPDLLQPELNGYIFKSGDAEGLKNSMNKSLTKFKEMGNRSAEFIQNWSYKSIIESLDQLFNL